MHEDAAFGEDTQVAEAEPETPDTFALDHSNPHDRPKPKGVPEVDRYTTVERYTVANLPGCTGRCRATRQKSPDGTQYRCGHEVNMGARGTAFSQVDVPILSSQADIEQAWIFTARQAHLLVRRGGSATVGVR